MPQLSIYIIAFIYIYLFLFVFIYIILFVSVFVCVFGFFFWINFLMIFYFHVRTRSTAFLMLLLSLVTVRIHVVLVAHTHTHTQQIGHSHFGGHELQIRPPNCVGVSLNFFPFSYLFFIFYFRLSWHIFFGWKICVLIFCIWLLRFRWEPLINGNCL